MNYGKTLKQIHYYEFIPEFNEEYKEYGITYEEIYKKIKVINKIGIYLSFFIKIRI